MDEIEREGKKYVSLTKLAENSGYDREYLRKLAKSGKVDAIQIEHAWLVNPNDLKRYQAGRGNRQPHIDK